MTNSQGTHLRDALRHDFQPDTGLDKWVCDSCGFVYDPSDGDRYREIPAGTGFENLPGDWQCPECGADKDYFIR